MKKNRKIFSILLVLLTIFVFSSCSVINNDISENTATVSDSNEDTTSGTDGKKLLEGINEIPVLVVLVNYNDLGIDTSDSIWAEKYFGDENSVSAYYSDMSQEGLDLVPANEKVGTIDDGIVSLDIDELLPTDQSIWDDDSGELWQSYCENLAALVELEQYDVNGDGVVIPTELSMIFIVPGYDDTSDVEGLIQTVWPYEYTIASESEAVNVDNVDLISYYTVAEHTYNYNTEETGIVSLATLCHEFGHLLGLPDLYDTTDITLGIGIHGLMGGFITWLPDETYNEIPPELDAWSKEYLGFVEPEIVTESGMYELYTLDTGEENILKIPIEGTDEYFLLENRSFTLYNESLGYYCESPGIVIWHIDEGLLDSYTYTIFEYETFDNGINDDYENKGVEVVEASLGEIGYSQLDYYEDTESGDYTYSHYFVEGDVFSDTTEPSSNAKDGSASGITVEVLSIGQTSEIEITIE
jgi:M6 family metalloprotease-like protein